MNANNLRNVVVLVLASALLGMPAAARACATCFGASDSNMAKGMNMGILSLLVVVVGVLIAFAAFFVFLARRAAAFPVQPGSALGSSIPQ